MTFTRETTIGKKVYTVGDFMEIFVAKSKKRLSDSDLKGTGFYEGMDKKEMDLKIINVALGKVVKDPYFHEYIHAQQTASKYPLGNWLEMPKEEKQRCYESAVRHACQFLEAGCPPASYEYENHYAAFRFNYRMYFVLQSK